MRFLITSVTGKKGYKSFQDLNEYVDFMTKKGHLIKDLQEADLPYTEKPVEMVKATQSKGWEEVSDFGDVTEDAEKSASLIASTSDSVMKDEANMEFSKSSEKADKSEESLADKSGDVDVEKSEKADKDLDKDIEECLLAAGVSLNEDWEEISKKEVKSEKADSLMTNDIKDEAGMKFSKSSEKADKNEKGLGGESGDINMKDIKKYDYTEPELNSEKNASKAQTEYKEVKKLTEEKQYSNRMLSNEIRSVLKNAGVKVLKEFFHMKNTKPSNKTPVEETKKFSLESIQSEAHSMMLSHFYDCCSRFFNSLSTGLNADAENERTLMNLAKGIEKIIREKTGASEYTVSPVKIAEVGKFLDSLPNGLGYDINDDVIKMIYDNCDAETFNAFALKISNYYKDKNAESKMEESKKEVVEVKKLTEEDGPEIEALDDIEDNEEEILDLEMRSAKDLIKSVKTVIGDDDNLMDTFTKTVEEAIKKVTGKSEYTLDKENLEKAGELIDSLQSSMRTEVIDTISNDICNNYDEETFMAIVDAIKNAKNEDLTESQLNEFFKFGKSENDYAPFDEEFHNICRGLGFNRFFKKCRQFFGNMGSRTLDSFKKEAEFVKDFQNDRKKIDYILSIIYENCDEGCRERFANYIKSATEESKLNEERKRNIINKEPEPKSDEQKAFEEAYKYWYYNRPLTDELKKICMEISKKYNVNGEDLFNKVCENKKLIKEGIKDYLPRAGFIRSDDEDKSSSKMGVWGGQGTDEQLRKAKIIAKVKFANGDRMGRVTKDDLEHFDEYKAQYDEIYGSDEELEEGWKDKLKKGAATLGVAASLAGNAMAGVDPMYDGARDPSTEDHTAEYSQSVEKPNYEAPRIARMKGNMVIDQFGNEWTREEFDKLANGEDPYYDGARNPNIEEEADDSSAEVIEEDDGLNLEIAECLRAAGC